MKKVITGAFLKVSETSQNKDSGQGVAKAQGRSIPAKSFPSRMSPRWIRNAPSYPDASPVSLASSKGRRHFSTLLYGVSFTVKKVTGPLPGGAGDGKGAADGEGPLGAGLGGSGGGTGLSQI